MLRIRSHAKFNWFDEGTALRASLARLVAAIIVAACIAWLIS